MNMIFAQNTNLKIKITNDFLDTTNRFSQGISHWNEFRSFAHVLSSGNLVFGNVDTTNGIASTYESITRNQCTLIDLFVVDSVVYALYTQKTMIPNSQDSMVISSYSCANGNLKFARSIYIKSLTGQGKLLIHDSTLFLFTDQRISIPTGSVISSIQNDRCVIVARFNKNTGLPTTRNSILYHNSLFNNFKQNIATINRKNIYIKSLGIAAHHNRLYFMYNMQDSTNVLTYNLISSDIDSLYMINSRSYPTGITHEWNNLKYYKGNLFCTTHATYNGPGYIQFNSDSLSVIKHFELQQASNGYGLDILIKNDTIMVANEDFNPGDHFVWYNNQNNLLNVAILIDSNNTGIFGNFDNEKYSVIKSTYFEIKNFNNICNSKSYYSINPLEIKTDSLYKRSSQNLVVNIDNLAYYFGTMTKDNETFSCPSTMHDPLYKSIDRIIYVDLLGRFTTPFDAEHILFTRCIQFQGKNYEYRIKRP